ncbi:MAG: TonB-dependent receptor plug domain-containing protein, partial [Salinivirgaceae bacterium]
MKKNLLYIIASLVLVVLMGFSSSLFGQSKLDIDNLTKDEIVNLSYETLMELPLGDLMRLADIVGMTTDELLQLAIVSASKESESLFDAPLSASVLTGENIKKAGVTSIMEALRLAPGVIVREQTPGNYDIHIRGYDDLDPNGLISFTRNAITLVMVNNRIVYNEFQGNTYWELLQLSVDDVDRIEVVRGPVSAMYGPNAVSGVINILTKNPGEEKGMHVSTYSQAGAFNTMVGNTALSYGGENGFSVRVAGNYDYRHRHQSDYYILSGKRYVRNDQGVIIGAETIDGGFVDELTGDELNIAGGMAVDPDANPATATPNFRERYPYPDLATDRKSVNAHLAYTQPDYTVNVMGGYATAMVQNSFPINNFAALSTDSLNNMFGHLWGNYKDFTFSADYNVGDMKTLGSGSALQADYQILNFNAEYSYDVFKGFNLKPGLSYRNAVFNGRILGSSQLDENYNV